jgi:hypothetical protein
LALTRGLILLPLDQELDNFPLRMIKVLQTLEIAEQRSQLEILGNFTALRYLQQKNKGREISSLPPLLFWSPAF